MNIKEPLPESIETEIESLRNAAQEAYNRGMESNNPQERQECFEAQQTLDRQADDLELELMENGSND